MDIFSEFSDVFLLENDKLKGTTAIHNRIITPPDTQPIYVKSYRLPQKHKEEISKQVEQMEKDGIITLSTSPWNAPLLVIPKKMDSSGKQKYRVCVDFRKLNNITIGDVFPMPNINDILDQLGNSKYYSTLDLARGYHQVPVRVHIEDRVKTSFSTD